MAHSNCLSIMVGVLEGELEWLKGVAEGKEMGWLAKSMGWPQ